MIRFAPLGLSLLRIALTPLLWFLIISEYHALALFVFGIAAGSDWLDGYIARKYKITSIIGAWTDFLADKILIGTVLVALVVADHMFPLVAALIIGREVAVVLLRIIAAFLHEQIEPSLLGKRKMFVQCAAIIASLLWWPAYFAHGMAGVAALITILSGMAYLWNARRLFFERVQWWRIKAWARRKRRRSR